MNKGDKRMAIAASIVSAVLKSVAGDKFGRGLAKDLIGISIDGISEKGINEIADFINDRKSKIDSILSNENMKSIGISEDTIDYVVVEIRELLSGIDITDIKNGAYYVSRLDRHFPRLKCPKNYVNLPVIPSHLQPPFIENMP